jgi:hypothetical protein
MSLKPNAVKTLDVLRTVATWEHVLSYISVPAGPLSKIMSGTRSENSRPVHTPFTASLDAAGRVERTKGPWRNIMAALDLDGLHTPGLRPLEKQILEEKAKGLSDLEVASKFFLYEREVRSITQRLKRRGLDGKMMCLLREEQTGGL